MVVSAPVDRRERHSQRSIDIIVHGATGFTGRRVARDLASRHSDLNIAICGRSKDKLLAVAADLTGWDDSKREQSIFVVSNIVEGFSELVSVFSKAKIVIACAGPYRQCGLPILKAAIEARCDYLDLCGEPQFFDDALLAFDREARAAGVLAIHAAAFDCVPAELGVALAEKELLRKYASNDDTGGKIECAGIEVIHTMQDVSRANATTFHAAVDGFHAASSGDLTASRKRVKENFPEFEENKPPPRPKNWPKVPEIPGAILPGYNDELALRTMRFVGADASAIRSSWRYLRSRRPDHPRKGKHIPEPRLSVLVGMDGNDSMTAAKVMAYGAAFSTLARWKWGCDWLHSRPEAFSGGFFCSTGPTEEELEKARFTTHITAFGNGHGMCTDGGAKEQMVRVKVCGPEPGYVATPRLIIGLALTVLDAGNAREDTSVNFSFEGGVTLPGALFADCDHAYDKLRKEGVSFDIVG